MTDIRSKFNIPDVYVKDTHLTNWLKKRLIPDLIAAFIDDKDSRGTISKSEVLIGDRVIILCLSTGKRVVLDNTDYLTIIG